MNDAVVVGSGVAGTTLAIYLKNSGRDVLLIGDNAEASSHVAAGIVNPITGRRYALSWNFPELIKEAKQFYGSQDFPNHLEQKLIYRALPRPKNYNEWDARSTQYPISEYGETIGDNSAFSNIWNTEVIDWLKIRQGGRLDIASFLKDAHKKLRKNDAFLKRKIYSSDLSTVNGILHMRNAPAGQYFFAEGSIFNGSFFPQMPVEPAKGEVLILHSDDLPTDLILKNQNFLVHLKDKLFWFGSNYERNPSSPFPTENTYLRMLDFLDQHACFSYKVIAQRTGLRPTVPDRRPLVGRIPSIENAFIFNGMGAKGGSLSPWCAKQLLAFLDKEQQIPDEIDLQRYAETWTT